MMSRKQTLASDVLAALEAKKLSLATAESCTGGGVGQALTAVPGSSRVYRGGIISYTNEVKSGLLHVPETLLRDLGAVSGPVAEAMARGARRPFLRTWQCPPRAWPGPAGMGSAIRWGRSGSPAPGPAGWSPSFAGSRETGRKSGRQPAAGRWSWFWRL